MPKFEQVNVSPNLQRLQRIFVNQMREAMQEYVDESDININLQENDKDPGFVIPLRYAAVLFNDLLLYCNDGQDLEKKVVTND